MEVQARQELIQQSEDWEMLVELEQAEVEDQLTQRRRRLGLEPEVIETSPPPPVSEAPLPEPIPDEPETPPAPSPAE